MGLGGGGMSTEEPGDDVPVDFYRDIQPILGDYCVRCHGGVRELGVPPLNLQTRERAAFVLGQAGNVETSLLYVKLTLEDPQFRMPLGQQPLPAEKLNKIRRWIFQGAPWPEHWSYGAMAAVDPTQLAVSDEAWVRTPVDRFILNRLDAEGLTHSPEADASTLLRRVSLDLTGLPPTPQELDAFAADASPAAYETVVDRLLASPGFGERWGRYWLDLARYSDSDGYEKDNFRTSAWRWRDWVVDSFNQDQGFDQFTIEQLGGDLMPAATPLQVAGTGFHRNTLVNREGGIDPEEDRSKRILDRAATVAETWLGLTLGCTQCHSHPYDNIKQKEFYRLVSFFNNADDGDDVTMGLPPTSGGAAVPVMVLKERTADRRPMYLFERGDFLKPDKAEELVGDVPAVLPPLNPRGATPDRLDLGRWLVDAKNPLTPRVAVNTIWYHLFGQGIVTTLGDFGARSTYPSHPELLDWLASDFVSNGWKRKRLIKEIVMSSTYRQSAVLRPEVTKDAENTLLWRQNRLRVEAEIVPDIFLSAAGLLSSKMGGPSAYPPLPDELRKLAQGAYGGFNWPDATGEDRYRRGMYTLHKRLAVYPNLAVFDWPGAAVSTTGRPRSNTPLQALATQHSVLFVEAAQALARRVQQDKPGSLAEQIVWAFRLATARPPTDAEASELQALFNDTRALYANDPQGAQAAVGTFMPAGADAATAAAWVSTASAILNLDEVVNRE